MAVACGDGGVAGGGRGGFRVVAVVFGDVEDSLADMMGGLPRVGAADAFHGAPGEFALGHGGGAADDVSAVFGVAEPFGLGWVDGFVAGACEDDAVAADDAGWRRCRGRLCRCVGGDQDRLVAGAVGSGLRRKHSA
ncbi:hypothetical protein [Candidatus Poriferisodalis sp.]|uniref:hypothetical protein n=1 Tax=Candidatus Poriferisodalis sp. TaxID=3101277 RepID=UPI003B025FAD